MNTISDDTSRRIWIMKAFAVIAIAACHCVHVGDNTGAIWDASIHFFNYWIGLGVPVFFFLAGYVFNYEDNAYVFISKKLKSIVLPWLVTGTVVWLYVVLRKGGISFQGWFEFIFARKSYLWFLTDLMLYYVLFFTLLKNRISSYLLSTTVFLIWGLKQLNVSYPIEIIERYTGIQFYCLVLFWFGYITRKYLKVDYFNNKWFGVLFLVYFFYRTTEQHVSLPSVFETRLFDTVMTACFLIGLYSISGLFKGMLENVMMKMGRESFSIYLLHMPIAGLTANMLNRQDSFAILTFVRPLIVVCITMIGIDVYYKIFHNNSFMMLLFGKR